MTTLLYVITNNKTDLNKDEGHSDDSESNTDGEDS
jgi:hypothetical protein